MSTLKVNTIQNTSGVEQYMCKAWVRFNASTGSPVINASGNVSSITDNALGDFTINFTNAMVDANYSWSIYATNLAYNVSGANVTAVAAGSIRYQTGFSGVASPADWTHNVCAIFR